MNDNTLRGPQWKVLVAEYFRPRYGGDKNSWGEANTLAIGNSIQRNAELVHKNLDFTTFDFKAFSHNDLNQWLVDMFEFVGIALPPAVERERIIKNATQWIISRIQSAYPKVSETIHALKNRGYILYTATGELSEDIKTYLLGMEIKDCFQEFYGPDIINTPKTSRVYYERMFRHAHINPKEALVVDDAVEKLVWAKTLGANTLLVNSANNKSGQEISHQVEFLYEILDLVDMIQ